MIYSVYTYYTYVTLLLDIAVLARSAWCLCRTNGKYKVFLIDINSTSVFHCHQRIGGSLFFKTV
jgi:hypothetical protein